MAKKKMQRRSRKKQPVRLLNVAQGLLIGNVLLEGAFQTNVFEFVTGRKDGSFNPGGDGRGFITLPELLGFADTPYGFGKTNTNSFQDVVMTNLKRPGVIGSMVVTTMLAKPAFRLGKKALGPVIRPINRQLKGTGVAL